MKKVLITGGTGFIGRNICESRLPEHYQLIAPKRAELDCSDDDSVRDFFSKHEFDVIIHSAAKPGHRNATDTQSLLYTNARMMQNLLKYRSSWGKLLNMGSGAIYDMEHYIPKMKEDYFGTYIPKDEHGFNKYLFGKMLPCLENVYDLRLFGIFGKYEDYAIRFISNAICKSIFGLPITLRQNRKFDYLYVNDLFPILEYFIENNPAEKAFNITPDTSVELLQLAHMVGDITGNPIEPSVAMGGIGLEYSGDNSRLRLEMKNVSFTSIESAITELYQWCKQNINIINKNLLLTDK